MPLQPFFYQLGLIVPEPDYAKELAPLRRRKVEPVSAAEDRPQPEGRPQRPPQPLQNRTSVLAVQVACLEDK